MIHLMIDGSQSWFAVSQKEFETVVKICGRFIALENQIPNFGSFLTASRLKDFKYLFRLF